ncbi:MAG: ATP-binding cassette domain-containing protein [Verrucomicrobia bacterium]|nr:ATP-binding cassette domain-containing protein [Verrucomicrobiota bacterium]
MALFSLLDLSHAFGGAPVLDHVNFQVDPGERVCLVGRNGAGKSTLMKLIAGDMRPDTGQVFRQPGAHFARLVQEVPQDLQGTVHDLVASGVRRDAAGHEEDWEIDVRIEDLIARLQLSPTAEFSQLSGGLKRRVLLGRAIASKPDLLLLDEPTNHLDIESILWLEEFLLTEKIGLFFVTHDRAFLQKLATRIVELDRGVLTNWACSYDQFLLRRAERLEAEERQRAAADKKLAQEEEWIRRGVRAQRKRAGNRIEALYALRAERKARREQAGSAVIRISSADESGVKVIEAANIAFGYPGAAQPLVRDFSAIITRGDKIGLIGPNGAGKTTFLKLLLGQLQPTAGTLKHGTKLEVVYFDQLRAQIDDNKTVADNVSDGNSHITVDGRSKHVIGYLQDFLFEPERSRTPARVLSGGERNRLLLARLFTKPANVLVLDEPTNDLDAETLDLLENLLVEFEGTVLVVSHDRKFLDEVVTGTYVFDGKGGIEEFIGGYSDWVAEKAKQAKGPVAAVKTSARAIATPAQAAASAFPVKATGGRKLNNREQRELTELPAKIEKLETEQAELAAKLGDPKFFKQEASVVRAAEARLSEIEKEHAVAFARWEELEAAANGG